MSRAINKLSAKRVVTLRQAGWHGDGGGLWLRIFTDGSKRWVFTWERNKRRREMGIGPLGSVSLSMARAKAQAARDQLAAGIDPLETKREQEEVIAVQAKPVELTDASVPKFGE